jgi:anhydro-N-acetylmuramic acid kinase
LVLRVIGLMSGTSYDGIDVAAAEFDRAGDTLLLHPLGALAVPYEAELRDAIAAVLPPAATTVEAVCRLTTGLGRAYGQAAARGLAELAGGRADLVVSHGQTVFHWVRDGRAQGSLQLGQPAYLAAATGLPVLSDLRAADIAAGGQGAPLVPVFDALLLAPESDGVASRRRGGGSVSRDPGAPRRAALNLGGIANITVLADTVTGYDTGPANALIDAACRRWFGEPYDAGGRHAAAGTVLPDLLAALLAEPYYAAPAPKSTGKELFHAGYLDRFVAPGAAGEDVVATVTELTARTVADQLRAHRVAEVIGAGGGMHNPVLTARIAELSGADLHPVTGIDPDAKEAYAFALLGWLAWHGLPGSLPSVTGADHAALLGTWTPGRRPLRLPEPLATPPRRLRLQ